MAKRRARQAGEGSIFFDKGKQLWTARVTDPETGKRVSKSAKQAKLVKAWFEEQKSAVARGLPTEPSRSETLAEFLPRWLELASPRLKPRTVISYEQLIHNHLIPELGRHRLRRLTPQHVQAFINERGHERSARTVMHIHACLQVALRDAMRWGLIARNVASKDFVTLPRVVEAEIHPFIPTEAGQLLAAAAGERFEHLYTMLLSTGLRLGEALALRWQDVDLDAKPRPFLRVRRTLLRLRAGELAIGEPKSRTARRTVHLVAPAVAALRAQKDRQMFERRALGEAYTDQDLVFAQPTGVPSTESMAEHDFKKALKIAGLDRIRRPHDLRHSCATYLLAAGVSEMEIQQILGHSNLAMTRHYEHVLDDMRAAAADRLESWLGTSLDTNT